MHSKQRFHTFSRNWNPTNAALAIMLTLLFLIFLFLFIALTALPAHGQTYRVIYSLNEVYGSGMSPFAGPTIDAAGNLYVTTKGGGYGDYGTVFELYRGSSGWVYSAIYDFGGGNDGAGPYDRVVFGPDGSLYGATGSGGGTDLCNGLGCGTVFKLSKQGTSWRETILYAFQGGTDGMWPYNGDLVFDQAGDIYGTTEQGGYTGGNCAARDGCGVAFKLAPSVGGYTESVLYSFTGGTDGGFPQAGVIFDRTGDLYGVAGNTVYELTPSANGWAENILYILQGGRYGGWAFGGLIFDQQGNLYGTTYLGGSGNAGTVFELKPLNGEWTYDLLSTLMTLNSGVLEYRGPTASLTMDATGNLYGTTSQGGRYGWGAVFKLTPSGNGWTYTSMHDFCRGGYPCNDGALPAGGVTLDAHGNLYGTTEYGGGNWGGVVWEITP